MYKFDAENRFQYHDFEPIVLQDKVQECEKRAAHYGRAYFGHNCHLLIEVNAIMSGKFAKRIPTDYRLNLLELQKVNDKENYILSESAYLFWFAKK